MVPKDIGNLAFREEGNAMNMCRGKCFVNVSAEKSTAVYHALRVLLRKARGGAVLR
jgi:hypothetical protein